MCCSLWMNFGSESDMKNSESPVGASTKKVGKHWPRALDNYSQNQQSWKISTCICCTTWKYKQFIMIMYSCDLNLYIFMITKEKNNKVRLEATLPFPNVHLPSLALRSRCIVHCFRAELWSRWIIVNYTRCTLIGKRIAHSNEQ